jgi:hypothetical protein
MKCHHCDKPAFYLYGKKDEPGLPLCIDCNLKVEQAAYLQFGRQARFLNYLSGQVDFTMGLPGFSPKIQVPEVHQVGSVTLHNVKIDNSNVGLVNTGSIQTVDSAVGVLRSHNEENGANALARIAEGIVQSEEISQDEKNRLLEQLSVISTEAAAPAPERRRAAMRPLLRDFGTAVGAINGLVALWAQVGPPILALFS